MSASPLQDPVQDPDKGDKMVSFRFPRYQKRSMVTIMAAFVLPSAIYAFSRGLTHIPTVLSFFGHALASVLNTITSLGYYNSLYVSLGVQIALMVYLYRTSRLSVKTSLAIAVTVGMLDLVGLKLMDIG